MSESVHWGVPSYVVTNGPRGVYRNDVYASDRVLSWNQETVFKLQECSSCLLVNQVTKQWSSWNIWKKKFKKWNFATVWTNYRFQSCWLSILKNVQVVSWGNILNDWYVLGACSSMPDQFVVLSAASTFT